MTIAETLRTEYDREMAATRRLLERLPMDALDWRPHPKSMTLGALAAHLAETASWTNVLTTLTYDADAATRTSPTTDPAVLLAAFDESVDATRRNLTGKTDAELTAVWTVRRDGQTMFTIPRMAMLRGILLNHHIHHRGQLTVYLRLRDIPLPAIYGPSADEALA